MNSFNPIVSVIMITYGHESYIKQAIEGVLMQDCNFEFQLIVANDCSPDYTDSIVEKVISDHNKSEWLNYSRHDNNKGVQPNFLWAYNQCKGKYIAICEGDDYWTDPYKLQKQVDFLEANPEYSGTFHKTLELWPDENLTESSVTFSGNEEKKFEMIDLLKANCIHTPSLLFRKEGLILADWLKISPAGDYPLIILLLKRGPLFYFPEPMAVYRRGVGTWNIIDNKLRFEKWLLVLGLLLTELKEEEHIEILMKQYQFNLKQLENATINKEFGSLSSVSNKLTWLFIIKLLFTKPFYIIKNRRIK